MMDPKNPQNTKVIAFNFLKIKSNDWRQNLPNTKVTAFRF